MIGGKYMKKYLAYILLGIGFFICTCLSLLILNLIGIGHFENIIGDAFPIAVAGGAMLLLPKLFIKENLSK